MFALVFQKNARQFMSTLFFSALLSSHVWCVALLFPPRRFCGCDNNMRPAGRSEPHTPHFVSPTLP